MKVKLLKVIFREGGKKYGPGSVIDLPDWEANDLIKRKLAVEPKKPQKKAGEASNSPATPHTATPPSGSQDQGNNAPGGEDSPPDDETGDEDGGDEGNADESGQISVDRMTREELEAELTASGVIFGGNMSVSKLRARVQEIRAEKA